jgi:hypothetical protein
VGKPTHASRELPWDDTNPPRALGMTARFCSGPCRLCDGSGSAYASTCAAQASGTGQSTLDSAGLRILGACKLPKHPEWKASDASSYRSESSTPAELSGPATYNAQRSVQNAGSERRFTTQVHSALRQAAKPTQNPNNKAGSQRGVVTARIVGCENAVVKPRSIFARSPYPLSRSRRRP